MGSQTILSDDVTRLKEILGELQQHGEIGLWILDTATGRVEWDDIVTAIAGVESARITTPQALLRLVHPDDRHMLVGSLRDAIASGEDHHVLYRVVNNDRWVECWARPERDAACKVVRLRGFLRNISDIRNTEMALTEIEARFQRMAENSPDMLFRLPPPGGRFEYVSPASTRIFGYRPEEFIAHPDLLRERLHPEDATDFKTRWKELSEGSACPDQAYRIIHRDGTCRWVSQR
ncbi:MAG: PAS domain-containing protein, partial [gamma proteobacterium symbiont of Phacoides pectinatus]